MIQQGYSFDRLSRRLAVLFLVLVSVILYSCCTESRSDSVGPVKVGGVVVDRASRVADLASRYGGKINTGATGNEIIPCIQQAASLMDEWNPIGYALEDVKAIMGTPTSESADLIEYRLDTGWGGSVWVFLLDEGSIVGVRFEDIDE